MKSVNIVCSISNNIYDISKLNTIHPQKPDLGCPNVNVLEQPFPCLGVLQLTKRIPTHSSADSKGPIPESSLEVWQPCPEGGEY